MAETLLFKPMTLRGVTLRNRIVVPPMHQYSAVKGFPTDWHLMNAGKFAAGGAGLVVVESTKVERRGCGTVGDLGIWDDKFVEPLRRLVAFIKEQNAVAGIPARTFRAQGARQSSVGGRRPASTHTRHRGLGGVAAGRAKRDRPQCEMAGAAAAGTS
jgi:NADH:flavin oxidoreductase / NADH oxidase family